MIEERNGLSAKPYLIADLRQGLNGKALDTCHLPACPLVAIADVTTFDDGSCVDVVVDDEQSLDEILAPIAAQPQAAATLVQVLRAPSPTVAAGLVRESLAYSTLQQSSGFRAWLRGRAKPVANTDSEPLLIERRDDVLHLTLNRPAAHNAYSMQLKDALCAALHLAHADASIRSVEISGKGKSFCAGGDLTEFGAVTDAAEAHLSRTIRSAGYLIATAPCTVNVSVHGACIGAGIELPAFATHITAHRDSFFQLPEVAMGLIPGAGGTVSIAARVGRQRTAWLALSNKRLDADTALNWGLVDQLTG